MITFLILLMYLVAGVNAWAYLKWRKWHSLAVVILSLSLAILDTYVYWV